MPLSQYVLFGEVNRLSSSGNAIIRRESIQRPKENESMPNKEVNLGPLPQDAVGEEIPFAYQQGTWGFCLDIEYIDEDYIDHIEHLHQMNKIGNFDSTTIEPTEYLTAGNIPSKISPGNILTVEEAVSIPDGANLTNIPDGEYLAVIVDKTNNDWKGIGIIEDSVIESEISPVIVTQVNSNYLETRGALPEIEETPDIGEKIKVTTSTQNKRGTLAVYDGNYSIPVLIKNAQYPCDEVLKVKITDMNEAYSIGEPVFSVDDFDTLCLNSDEISSINRQSHTQLIKNEVPIDIEPVPENAPSTERITVTDKKENSLIAQWDIRNEIGDAINITAGDKISFDVHSVEGNSCIGYYKRFPIEVNFNTAVPQEFENERLLVSVQKIQSDKAIATPARIEEADEPVNIRIIGTNRDCAIAISESTLVKIPNPSVIQSGDKILVGIKKSEDNNITVATVSARPIFQNTDGLSLIRLPHTQGEVVNINGTYAFVDHLPDMDTPVTLGVAEVNEDHIVPSIAALPETHLPDEGDCISVECERISDRLVVSSINTVTEASEELPVEIPIFLAEQRKSVTVRILNHQSDSLFGVVSSADNDDSENMWEVLEYLQVASLNMSSKEYKNAINQLNEARKSCSEDYPVIERIISYHEKIIQTMYTIRNNTGFERVISELSQEADLLQNINCDQSTSANVDTLISAYEAEIRAAQKLLTALNEIDSDTGSDLQAIAQAITQGSNAKDQILKASEYLEKSKQFGAQTEFEEELPSLGIRSVIEEFEQAFPGITDELQSVYYPEHDVDWFQYFVPDWIPIQTGAQLPSDKNGVDNWKRPDIPDTIGIIPAVETDTHKTKNNKRTSTPVGPDADEHSIVTESTPVSEDTKQEPDKDVPVSKNNSNEKNAETETSYQGSFTGETSEKEEEAKPRVSEDEAHQSEIPDEPLSIPEDTPQLQRLRKKAETEASIDPEREHVETTTSRYRRSSAIKKYAIQRADGTCELCGERAPFVKSDGEPYLEVHHVNELSEGGADHPSLVGAICPNCHREIHHGKNGQKLNQLLKTRLENGLGDVGTVND